MTTRGVIERQRHFENWLAEMDDALDRFLASLPGDVRSRLDYSPQSLPALEEWLLSRYAGTDAMLPMGESQVVDGAARYVGEVFRKALGGKWTLELKDKRNAFHGLPQLTGLPGQQAQICPLTWVTASADRRTGRFLQTIYLNNEENAKAARPGG
jgi:hypothetical protein